MLKDFRQGLKNDLIAGLLVVIPLATTIWLTITVASWVIRALTRFPKQLNPFIDLHPALVALFNLGVGFAVPLLVRLSPLLHCPRTSAGSKDPPAISYYHFS